MDDINKKNNPQPKRFSAISEAIEKRKQGTFSYLPDISVFLLALIFARCHVAFGAHPLAIALLATLPRYVWVALGGSVLGSLSLGKAGIIYSLVCAIVVFLRLAVSGGTKREADGSQKPSFSENPLIRLSASVIGGFIISIYEILLSGFSKTVLLFCFTMVILTPLLTFIFSGLFETGIGIKALITYGSKAFNLSGKSNSEKYNSVFFRISVAVSAFFITLSLKNFELLGISLAYIFPVFCTIIVSRKFGALHGGGFGFASALALSPNFAVAFALSGLAAGALFRIGLPYALVGGGISLCAWSAYTGGLTGFLTTFPEYIIGAALAYPIISRIKGDEKKESTADSERSAKDMVGTMALSYRGKYSGCAERLEDAMRALSSAISKFAKGSEQVRIGEYRDIIKEEAEILNIKYDSVGERLLLFTQFVIANKDYYADKLSRQEKLEASDFLKSSYTESSPDSLLPYAKELAESVNKRAAAKEEECYKKHTAICAEDYSAIAKIISEARLRDDAEKAADPSLDTSLSGVFEGCGFSDGMIRALGERYKHIIAAGEDEDGIKITSPELKLGIEEAAGIKLSEPEYYRRGNFVLMEATAKRRFAAEFATAGRQGNQKEVSGDTAIAFESTDDKFYALISDGMGSGEIARGTSLFVSDFIRGLYGNGSGGDAPLHMLNNMIRAGADECSATVDLFEFDLMNSEARFLKCGAAPSYVKRGSSIFRIRSRTAPIGLMKNVDAECVRVEIRNDDCIIMLSDGICQASEEAPWLLELLSKYNDRSISNLASDILSAAQKNTAARDDMTVLVVKIIAA